VMGREKIASFEDLRVREAPRMLYFKHEERPTIVVPHKLVIGRVQTDDLNRGYLKVNIAFTLPPGAYATLVIKRLFHFEYEEESAQKIREGWYRPPPEGEEDDPAARKPRRVSADEPRAPRAASRGAAPAGRGSAAEARAHRPSPRDSALAKLAATPTGPAARRSPDSEPTGNRRAQPREAAAPPPPAPTPPAGFRERQQMKKTAKEQARQDQAAKRPESRKKK
jgi:tRNA pseudouridine13 synthase